MHWDAPTITAISAILGVLLTGIANIIVAMKAERRINEVHSLVNGTAHKQSDKIDMLYKEIGMLKEIIAVRGEK